MSLLYLNLDKLFNINCVLRINYFWGDFYSWIDLDDYLGTSTRRWKYFYSQNITDNGTNVGIGTLTPATSGKLDITSTTGALIVPRMTTAQRDALTAVNGMIIYDITLTKFMFYENGAWVSGSGLA